MINLLSRDFPPAAFALVTGTLSTLGLFFMIQILSAGRGENSDPPPLLVIDLLRWQPARPAPLPKPDPPPKTPQPVPEKKPDAIPEKITQAPAVPTRADPVPEPAPEPPFSEPAETPPPTSTVTSNLPAEPTPADTLPTPVPLFQLTAMPRFLHRAIPHYPEPMRAVGQSGVVKLSVLIDKTGRVRRVTVLESAGALFDAAAEQAIMASRFIPAEVDGKPVAVLLRLPVRFRLR